MDASAKDDVYDVVGVGFGPAALALAIALVEPAASTSTTTYSQLGGLQQALEQLPTSPIASEASAGGRRHSSAPAEVPAVAPCTRPLRACFIEKHDRFRWHPGMMLEGSVMQISFLKDLATLRNPQSAYTFLAYLASFSPSRLVSFISRETFTPTRREFSDYLAWAARKVEQDLHSQGGELGYGEQVVSVEGVVDGANSDIRLLRVRSRVLATGQIRERLTRNIVMSTGGSPRIPSQFKTAELADSGRIVHTSAFLDAIPPLFDSLCHRLPAERPLRVAVIGSGQSAAETFLAARNELTSKLPTQPRYRPEVQLFIRSATLLPADDSASTNEVFDPGMSQAVYDLTPEGRAKMLQAAKATNYSVANPNTLANIYETLYAQQVEADIARRDEGSTERLNRDPRLVIRPFTEVSGAELSAETDKHIKLRVLNNITSVETVEDFDVVICATGYDRQGWKPLLFTPLSDSASSDSIPLTTLFTDNEPISELTSALSSTNIDFFSRSRSPHFKESRSTSIDSSQPDSPLLLPRDSQTDSSCSSPPTSRSSMSKQYVPDFTVAKNYRLQLPETTSRGLAFKPTVWLQGSCEATHGISDSLLSVLAVRSGEVASALRQEGWLQSATTNSSTSGGIADKISNAANYVGETVKEYTAGASKEGNKEVAKGHTDASLSERASAGLDAASDKINESSHGAKADAHKEAAKH
ncbi:hypothetical protein ACM66B_006710 [Microbotryomycetes sp. NB124-2]